MLQIITGKFFTGDGKVNDQQSDAILYSNYAWLAPVETPTIELRPVDTHKRAVSSYVVRYTNRYHQAPGDRMVFASADEAVDQFRMLCSFWFRAFFHVDRQHVKNLCRAGSRHTLDVTVPARFIPRVFDASIHGTAAEAAGFVGFLKQVLGMPRREYNRLMVSLGAYFNTLEAVGTNLDLAYSMFAYLLEALSQSGGQHVPPWADYDQTTRERLDEVLSAVESGVADRVRGVLLDNSHLKLMKRFVSFVTSHVEASFFQNEAAGLVGALRKSDLERAVRNLYSVRSGFVHELRQVHDQIRMPVPGWEVVEWANEPHLTLAGLVRLCRHVLMTFINRQPCLEHEEYPWRGELPGLIRVRMAPQYWVWPTQGFKPSTTRQRLSGFFRLILDVIQKPGTTLPDMRELLGRIEEMVPQAGPADRRAMLTLYELWHNVVDESGRRPNWEAFVNQYEVETRDCTADRLAAHVLLGAPLAWTTEACVAAFEEYQRGKFRPMGLNLPAALESATAAALANLFLSEGRDEVFRRWLDRTVLDAAGRPVLQKHLEECKANRKAVDLDLVIGRSPTPEPETPQTAELTGVGEAPGRTPEVDAFAAAAEKGTPARIDAVEPVSTRSPEDMS